MIKIPARCLASGMFFKGQTAGTDRTPFDANI